MDPASWQEVILVALNVVQTMFLAHIASRSNRLRRSDDDDAA